jgi:hypothetical protein
VFETTIRILGSLVSNHMLAAAGYGGHGWYVPPARPRFHRAALQPNLPRPPPPPLPSHPRTLHLSLLPAIRYNNCLLSKAQDMGDRLLKAYDTPTGIPYGTVNLRSGVAADETTIR